MLADRYAISTWELLYTDAESDCSEDSDMLHFNSRDCREHEESSS